MPRNSSTTSPRPYRSHARPACLACRKRKSMCKVEAHASKCLMCDMRGTPCEFPQRSMSGAAAQSRASTRRTIRASHTAAPSEIETPKSNSARQGQPQSPNLHRHQLNETNASASVPQATSPQDKDTPLSLSAADGDDNPHILGPVVSNDSHVLADYLSSIHAEAASGMRITRPTLAEKVQWDGQELANDNEARTGNEATIVFTHIQKRPLGTRSNPNASVLKLQIIEKLLEPWKDHLLELYLARANVCFPVVDRKSLQSQYTNAPEWVSPALLATIYANALTYWASDDKFGGYGRFPRPAFYPDERFVWNLANEALYSELYAAPGLATIPALLLNVGGRPTTSMIGNGVLLAAAVALAHAQGLNRNPLSWAIPQQEKNLRLKLWWCLLVHDRWTSLAYGTPPHIRAAHYDVPLPTLECMQGDATSLHENKGVGSSDQGELLASAPSVFIGLVGLTEVLSVCLEHIFDARRPSAAISTSPPYTSSGVSSSQTFSLRLHAWVEAVPDNVRRIAVRGTQLKIPGSANLRLAYLAVRLLLDRMSLDEAKKPQVAETRTKDGTPSLNDEEHSAFVHKLRACYVEIRRTADDIVRLVQELDPTQLQDFWLPQSAFTFSQTVIFLARCALEEESLRPVRGDSSSNMQTSRSERLARNPSLRLASELLAGLRRHREKCNWDLAELSLTQHSAVVDQLLSTTRQVSMETESEVVPAACPAMANTTSPPLAPTEHNLGQDDEASNVHQDGSAEPRDTLFNVYNGPMDTQTGLPWHLSLSSSPLIPSGNPGYGIYGGAYSDVLFPNLWDPIQES